MSANQTVNANFVSNINNLFFISSALYAGNLGSAAAYDFKCNSLATAAGINNASGSAFVAYLTDTSSSPARTIGSLLGGVTGSLLRVDGQPVAMKASDLFPGGGSPALLYPPNLDENGVTVPIGTLAMTGTANSGTASSGQNCGNWADGAASAGGGPAWSGPLFTQYNGLGGCSSANRIYCVEKDKSGSSAALTKPSGSKFIYAAPYTVNAAGIGAADSACSTTKPVGMTGAPLALLATTTVSAANRALVSTNLYVRPDFAVVGTGAEIATGTLRTGPWVGATGTIYGNYAAWGGATSLTVVGTAASTCNDWSSTASATPAYGVSGFAEPKFFYSSTGIGCSFGSAVIYCVEQ